VSEAPEALVAAIEPVLGALGLSLYDLELVGTAGKSRALRVLVDRPVDRAATDLAATEGDGEAATPLDLDTITEATRVVSSELDRIEAAGGPAAAVLRSQYTLEVSSPGLERPLRRPEHWRGAVGAEASVKSSVPAADGAAGETVRRHGVVLAVTDDGVDLEFDGAREHVAYTDIVQARTVFEWGAQAKPSAGTGKRGRSKREKVTQ
jgi:ribosome maturation factor RimP